MTRFLRRLALLPAVLPLGAACAVLTLLPCPASCAPGPFAKTPVLSVNEAEILADGKPVRGMFVFWHITDVKAADEKRVRAEFARMRRLGFIGVGLEAGWKQMNPAPDTFTFNAAGTDLLIKWAAAEGLWVHLLLTPHYTPEWVFTNHGDVKMKDPEGKSADGSFMTFSPYSPAVEDQAAFQAKAVAHFSRHPNILAFWLTNEQGFGAKWLDCSKWGLAAWRDWLKSVNSDVSFWNKRWSSDFASVAAVPIPAPGTESAQWNDWLRFRRVSLNDYWNRLYRKAKPARTRFIPIGHKFVLYNALDASAPTWAFAPSPVRLEMDILGCDAYGSTYGMKAAAMAFRKPIVLAETNFTATATGPTGKARTLKMLLDQQFHGAFVQTMYAWNENSKDFPWGVRDSSGGILPGGWGAVEAGRMIRQFSLSVPSMQPHVAVVVPANAFAARAGDTDAYQARLDFILRVLAQSPARAHLLFSDDLDPACYPAPPAATPAKGLSLEPYRVLIVCGDAGLDSEFLKSKRLEDWVEGGGVLLCDKLMDGPPEWMRIRQREAPAATSFSTTSAAGRWSFHNREQKELAALSLIPGPEPPGDLTVLGMLDVTREPVAMRVGIGKGRVVYAGAQLLLPGRTMMDAGLLWEALGLREIYPATTPPGPNWSRLGDGRKSVLFVESPSDWTGSVDLPGALDTCKVFDEKGVPHIIPPLKPADRYSLAGDLFDGHFCLVQTKE